MDVTPQHFKYCPFILKTAKKTEQELHRLPSDAKNVNPLLPTEDRSAGRGLQELYAPYLPGVHGDTCS